MNLLRSAVANRLSAHLLDRQNEAIRIGHLPWLPLAVWNSFPQATRKWLNRRVFKPSEEYAWQRLQADPELREFYNPKPNSFAIGPATIAFVWRLLHEIRPQRILEFGGGTSTRLCAQYACDMAKINRKVKIVSVDHEAEWLEETRRRVVADGNERFVEFVAAPLSEQNLLGRNMLAYTLPAERLAGHANGKHFELCLVDGPLGRVGRSGALAIAAPFLANDCIVLLDDAFRDGEQNTLREWKEAFPKEFVKARLVFADAHGLVAARWRAAKH